MKSDNPNLQLALSLGEGQTIEFKQNFSKIEKELVAFANSSGGTIYCGINDSGEITGTNTDNRTISELQDIANNCDPSVPVRIKKLANDVLAIEVLEGSEKPYQCSSGFYLRTGANSQKLKTNAIKILLHSGQHFFDSRANKRALFTKNYDNEAFEKYCVLSGINRLNNLENILSSLKATVEEEGNTYLTNAGVLLFTSEPSEFIPESYLTMVRYSGNDKFSIIDRQEVKANVVEQIELGMQFVQRHTKIGYGFEHGAKRREYRDYPEVAVREALINAVVHRDYSYQNSCVYLSIYSDRMEIENPGGLPSGLGVHEIEGRSVRRNPIVADLLYRAGYGEKLGSGLLRIKKSLADNGNPVYKIAATNFFALQFLPRIAIDNQRLALTNRQLEIISHLERIAPQKASAGTIANLVGVSSTTITRDLRELISQQIIIKHGIGKGTSYTFKKQEP